MAVGTYITTVGQITKLEIEIQDGGHQTGRIYDFLFTNETNSLPFGDHLKRTSKHISITQRIVMFSSVLAASQ